MTAHLLARGHADALLIRAALLHDVGKADGGIGIHHRVLWVLLGRLSPGLRLIAVRRGGAWAALANHAAIGASRLEGIGSDPRVIALVSGRALPGDEHRAELLRAADDAV